ncbi:hypothetical protein Tco_0624790 [Tanacetum coccineum]|uniref:Zf-CCHC domain-containing protein/UBN2 domain-containing protein n=1 Tax=Tanacetum coccineum TaxID=301880 RepID=A0ABQ4WF21_9ASTR
MNGDFPPVAKNEVTKVLEVVPFEEQTDELKKKLPKNNEAKMVLYNALPKKEYERILMCKTAKDIWQSLLITHQGNSQVKDNKIDLIVQKYEQFTILEEESIDSGFARFNTIINSLKALDEGFSSKNYVRKFLRALHPKWIAKVTAIEESKDLSSLALDELIDNLKKESSDDETSTSRSDDEEYAMAVRNFKKFFRRKGRFVRQPHEEKNLFQKRDDKKGKSDRKCYDSGCESGQQLRLENVKLIETQVKFVKFDKSANSLREMLNVQKSPSCKIGLGFDKSKVSTSGTKPISFVGSSIDLAGDRSTLKADRFTIWIQNEAYL